MLDAGCWMLDAGCAEHRTIAYYPQMTQIDADFIAPSQLKTGTAWIGGYLTRVAVRFQLEGV